MYDIDIWVNIGSGNGLLPDGTKPLPEPMLAYHQWGPKTWEKFHVCDLMWFAEDIVNPSGAEAGIIQDS